MKAKITKRSVDAVTAGPRDQFLWDTEATGFGLKVTSAGRRIYILQYRFGGRLRRYRIGTHGSPWTPDEARTRARRLLGMVADGIDPGAARAEEKAAPTVAELCDLYLEEGVTTKKASTVAMDRSRIERHIKPLLGRARARDVTRWDVERFMRDVAAGKTARDEKLGSRARSIVKGGKGVATRTVGLLGAIFTFAVSRGLRPDNPVRGVKRFPDRKEERFLSVAELARLGEALSAAEHDGEHPSAVAAIKLLCLTGCRKAEILSLRWGHVDLENHCLRLPESKTGAKVVRLGAPALELLAFLPHEKDNPYVFPGAPRRRRAAPGRQGAAEPRDREAGHYVGLQKAWARIRGRAGLADVKLHTLRHSFAAFGAIGGDSLLVIGALLGHRDAKSTHRYAHLSDDPLQAAADRISERIAAALTAKGGGEVVEMKKTS